MAIFLQQAFSDTYLAPILVGLTLAFVTQAVAAWMMSAATKQQVSGLTDDIDEIQKLHPRSSANPGKRRHRLICTNPDCGLSDEEGRD